MVRKLITFCYLDQVTKGGVQFVGVEKANSTQKDDDRMGFNEEGGAFLVRVCE